MMNTQRADRLLLLVLLILAVLLSVIAAVLVPPARQGSFDERPSTFFSAPHGTKAAYLALGKLGYTLRRLRRPIDTDTLQGIDGLIVLRPVVHLNNHERQILLAWVKRGHRLLAAPGALSADSARELHLTPWFNLTTPGVSAKDGSVAAYSTFDQPADALLAGIRSLTACPGPRFKPDAIVAGDLAGLRAIPLWSDSVGVVAARIPCGAGAIIALADVHALTNAGLREADNPLWLANIALELKGAETAVLAFDEYHAGFPYHAPSWAAITQLMLAEGWGASVVQLLLVAGLALWAAAVRFGRPRDIQPRIRRRQGEFVRAAGELLLRTGATALAQQALSAHYRARLCRLLHLGPTAGDKALAAALPERSRAELLELLQQSSNAARPGVLTARQLLDFCRILHRQLEAFEHGT